MESGDVRGSAERYRARLNTRRARVVDERFRYFEVIAEKGHVWWCTAIGVVDIGTRHVVEEHTYDVEVPFVYRMK